jgi:hypothetical protein
VACGWPVRAAGGRISGRNSRSGLCRNRRWRRLRASLTFLKASSRSGAPLSSAVLAPEENLRSFGIGRWGRCLRPSPPWGHRLGADLSQETSEGRFVVEAAVRGAARSLATMMPEAKFGLRLGLGCPMGSFPLCCWGVGAALGRVQAVTVASSCLRKARSAQVLHISLRSSSSKSELSVVGACGRLLAWVDMGSGVGYREASVLGRGW